MPSRSLQQRLNLRTVLAVTMAFVLIVSTWATVFAQAESGTIGKAGATVTFANGGVTLKAPDGAVTADVAVSYTGLTAATAPAPAPAGLLFGSQVFTLDAGSTTFSRFVEVSVKYNSADQALAKDGKDSNIALYTYDTVSKSWLELESALPNVIDLTLTASQTTVGSYAIVIIPAPEPTPEPVVVVEAPPTGDISVNTNTMAAFGVLGMLLIIGGTYLVSRRKSSI